MSKNVLFFISIVVFSDFSLIQTNDESSVQNTNGRHVFACIDSHFDSVMKVRKERKPEDESFRCNEIRVQKPETDVLYGLSLNRASVPLFTRKHYNSLIDRNGSVIANKFGTIDGGECDGSLLFVEDIEPVAKGSCNSSSGVTRVDSFPDGLALLLIRGGKCESTCVGRSVDDFAPGKRDN